MLTIHQISLPRLKSAWKLEKTNSSVAAGPRKEEVNSEMKVLLPRNPSTLAALASGGYRIISIHRT